MLFRVFLSLMVCALALFFAGLVLQKLALEDLAELIATLGADILLAGFALLIAIGIAYVLRITVSDMVRFFSAKAVVRRKVLFVQDKRREMQQRRLSELMQLNYFDVMQRARLLRVNDRKHVRLLAKAVNRQLDAARANMPQPLYKDMKKTIQAYRRRLDADALLSLQKQIGFYK